MDTTRMVREILRDYTHWLNAVALPERDFALDVERTVGDYMRVVEAKREPAAQQLWMPGQPVPLPYGGPGRPERSAPPLHPSQWRL